MIILPESCLTAVAKERFSIPIGTESPIVGGDVDDGIYRRVVDILKSQQHFLLEGYKDLCIRRRLAARIRAAGYRKPEEYVEFLAEDSREQEHLLAALSVHVSHFFRNPSMFKMLEKIIIPELQERTRLERCKLRIWCVGCAYGEEPYSVALLCQKLQIKKEMVSIIATDLNPEALRTARQGRFPFGRLQNVPESMAQELFTEDAGQQTLAEKVRELVQFFRHDILTDSPFYRAELILCRNLLIYFSREQQIQILKKLAEALLPGGYLILGRAETMAPACRALFHCVDPAERIYQRIVSDRQMQLI